MSEQPEPRLTAAEAGTPEAAFEFLYRVEKEGQLRPDQVKAFRNATLQVLRVDPEWKTLDLRELDLDAQAARFEEERHDDFSPGSLKNYRSRFMQTVNMYLAWARGEDDWKRHGPSPRNPRVKWEAPTEIPDVTHLITVESSPERAQVIRPQSIPAPAIAAPAPAPEPAPTATSVRMMPHTYPLRDDVDVQIQLPRDLTVAEANRLAKFISTLAWETEASV